MDILTTKQAADLLNLSVARVKQLLQDGIIPGRKFGRSWIIKKQDIIVASWKRTPGPERRN